MHTTLSGECEEQVREAERSGVRAVVRAPQCPDLSVPSARVYIEDVFHLEHKPNVVCIDVSVRKSIAESSVLLGRCIVSAELTWSSFFAGETLGVGYRLEPEIHVGHTELRLHVQEWARRHHRLLEELKVLPANAYRPQRHTAFEINAREFCQADEHELADVAANDNVMGESAKCG
jgi:hypothetical protein